jgi:hypothetical protein
VADAQARRVLAAIVKTIESGHDLSSKRTAEFAASIRHETTEDTEGITGMNVMNEMETAFNREGQDKQDGKLTIVDLRLTI